MLNPKAWADPARGQFGGPSYFGDFRGERRPVENFAVGRQFQIHEGIRLHIRAEFTNIFNCTYTYMNDPTVKGPPVNGVSISPQTAPVSKLGTGGNGGNGACSRPGMQISGFGSINTSTLSIRRGRDSSSHASNSDPSQAGSRRSPEGLTCLPCAMRPSRLPGTRTQAGPCRTGRRGPASPSRAWCTPCYRRPRPRSPSTRRSGGEIAL